MALIHSRFTTSGSRRLASIAWRAEKAVHTTAGDDKVEDPSVSTPNYTDEFSYPGLGCNRLMQMYDSAYDGYAEERHGKDEEIKVCTDENAEGDGGHSTPHG